MNDDQDLRSLAVTNAQRLANSLREDEAELARYPQFQAGLELAAQTARAAEDVKKLLERTK